ncbi:MAG TPA: VTT domain-containing protein, partial [Longimicrobium sp.]|nr:VTT domain-containing protein [Longimicrobium sp.]
MTELIHAYGVWAVLVGGVLEGEAVFLVAGYAASQGLLPAGPTLLAAVLGATLGDHGFYLVGRVWGPGVVRRSPRLRRLRAHGVLLVRRWGRGAAFGMRFAYGLRGVLPLSLGAARFPPALFVPFNLLGALAFACAYLGLGYVFGEAAEELFDTMRGHAPRIALSVVLLGAAAW